MNIDLNQVFHLHNTTKGPITVVYKKLPKKDISDVNAILKLMKQTMFVRINSLITNLQMNSSTCLQISLLWDTSWLIERLEEEAQKEYPKKLRYVLRDLAVKKELLLTNTQAT